MKDFLDSKDGGFIISTHIQLLIGCAIPVWLASNGYALTVQSTPFLSRPDIVLASLGLVSTGLGDAVAALYGSMYVNIDLRLIDA